MWQRFGECGIPKNPSDSVRALDETYGNKLMTFVDSDRNLMAVDMRGLVEVWRTADGCLD